MRASRLLAILLLLQTRGRMTAQTLAEEFEVSIRTIYRDIEQLSAADVPVYADRGPNGGFQLLDGYRTRLTGLSAAEASTLFLAGLPGPAAELGLAELMATAQLKLSAALPENARASASRVATRFHLDPVGWFRGADDARFLPVIAASVWNETAIDVRYRRYKGIVRRTLEPLGLILKGGIWYFVARADAQLRTYRVSNLVEVADIARTFERPKDFDLVEFWQTASRRYEEGLWRGTATLKLSPAGLGRLDALGHTVSRAARDSAERPGDDGRFTVAIPIESIEGAALDFLRLGTEAEVLAPPELRERVARLVNDLARVYAHAGSGEGATQHRDQVSKRTFEPAIG